MDRRTLCLKISEGTYDKKMPAPKENASTPADSGNDAAWKTRLTPLVRGGSEKGIPLALLVDAHDVREPILLEPLRPGRHTAWTRKRATWPDLVSTQWASVTEGINPTHLRLMRDLYHDVRSDSSWRPRNEVPLASLGENAFAHLVRLAREGVALFGALDPITPLNLDPSTWDLGLDLKGEEHGMSLKMMAYNGHQRIRDPRIDADAKVLILDGGLRLARIASLELLTTFGRAPLDIPSADIASFTTAFLPTLRRSYALISSDDSVDLEALAAPRLLARAQIEGETTLVVRWWAEYEFAGVTSRTPLANSLNAPGVRQLAERIDTLGTVLAPADMWAPGPATIRIPAYKAPEFRRKVVSQICDPALTWDLSRAVATLDVDTAALQVTAKLTDTSSDWFDLSLQLDVGGVNVELASVLEALASGHSHLLVGEQWVSLDSARLRELSALFNQARLLSDFSEPALLPIHLGLIQEIDKVVDNFDAPTDLRQKIAALKGKTSSLTLVDPHEAKLRPYQREGTSWLAERCILGMGAILADDMGLGKTLQILDLVASLKASDRLKAPVLVVAPTSVLPTWVKEAERFFPALRVAQIAQTYKRREDDLAELIEGADLIVTSYTIVRLEAEEWARHTFAGLVIDEAQNAKNPRTAIHKALAAIGAAWVLGVTGTPIENSLADLWAILALTTPGLLPAWRRFNEAIRGPIEKDGDMRALERLHQLIAPFMLRRTKEEVAGDLPDKTETIITVDLGIEHRRIYDERLMRERAKILSLLGNANTQIDILASITRLRQLALDPALVDPAYASIGSAKAEYLADRLDEIVPRGHRALVFSQFTSFLARIRETLERHGHRVVQLDGSTRDRLTVIEEFRSGRAPVFLISLKAGGTGLTLTEADYVYLMDPWWNPAAEAQAVDRAHRIGQTKKVNVYRLVAARTIEDKVVALQERKRRLVTSVIDGATTGSGLDLRELAELLE